jgi:hypothetical protein
MMTIPRNVEIESLKTIAVQMPVVDTVGAVSLVPGDRLKDVVHKSLCSHWTRPRKDKVSLFEAANDDVGERDGD